MTTRIAINGFGRIGRNVLRALIEAGAEDMRIVAINDLASPAQLKHLLKYDSVHGRFPGTVEATENSLIINGDSISVFSERNPENLPWNELEIDIVHECTGIFLTKDKAEGHLKGGAKRVLLSAPAKDKLKTVVYGINHDSLTADDLIVSNASCTTNALSPVAYVLDKEFGIETGFMTTIHAYTGDQPTLDAVHRDPYRGRAAALSMIPTTTGAAKAVSLVLPQLAGKLNGVALRVPVPNVSVVDLTVNLGKTVSAKDVNDAMVAASEGPLKGVLGLATEPLVSIDMNHDPHSSTLALDQTYVTGDNMVRVLSWYDNEWGFSNRMLDTSRVMASFL